VRTFDTLNTDAGSNKVEGWFDNYRPLCVHELRSKAKEIAHKLALFHTFHPDCSNEVTLWNQLFSWYDEAKINISKKMKENDNDADFKKSQVLLESFNVEKEIILQQKIIPKNAKSCLCHGDLQAFNIMVNDEIKSIEFIDFDYSGINYLAFDIANHFNEYEGGNDNAMPNYKLFPTTCERKMFIKSYLDSYEELTGNILDDKMNVNNLLYETDAFIPVNHLYWSLWAINQALNEGCDAFNYLLYAENRLKRYKECKNKNNVFM